MFFFHFPSNKNYNAYSTFEYLLLAFLKIYSRIIHTTWIRVIFNFYIHRCHSFFQTSMTTSSPMPMHFNKRNFIVCVLLQLIFCLRSIFLHFRNYKFRGFGKICLNLVLYSFFHVSLTLYVGKLFTKSGTRNIKIASLKIGVASNQLVMCVLFIYVSEERSLI